MSRFTKHHLETKYRELPSVEPRYLKEKQKEEDLSDPSNRKNLGGRKASSQGEDEPVIRQKRDPETWVYTGLHSHVLLVDPIQSIHSRHPFFVPHTLMTHIPQVRQVTQNTEHNPWKKGWGPYLWGARDQTGVICVRQASSLMNCIFDSSQKEIMLFKKSIIAKRHNYECMHQEAVLQTGIKNTGN